MSDSGKTPYATKAYKPYGAGAGQVVVWAFVVIAVLGGVLWILHQSGVLHTR